MGELSRRGRPVRATVRMRPEGKLLTDPFESGPIDGDTDWRPALHDVDAIVHTAARAHVLREETNEPLALFRRVNRDGTLRLAEQAAQAGVRRFVFISSIGVNGGETKGRPFRPEDPPAPHSPYAVAKLEAELGLREIAVRSGLEITIVRPPLVLGWGAKGNLGALARAIEKGLPLPLGGITRNRRDLVSLEVLVDLLIACIDHPAAAGETFLASDGISRSTRQIAERVGRDVGRAPRLVPIPARWLGALLRAAGKGGTAAQLLGDLQVDISRTRSLLGWAPPHSHEA